MANFLLDTNILLRMADEGAPQHLLAGEAVSLLLARSNEVYVTAQNLIEFWAVATRPLEANGFGWGTEQTASEIEQIRSRFPLLADTPEIVARWLTLVTAHDIKGKKVHDARLVAVMQVHGVTQLLTFNTDDFTGYSNLTVLHPREIGEQ
jgi:predicted nucleic acid-binding protein